MSEVESIINKLNALRTKYYNTGSEMDDEEFDFLEDKLRAYQNDPVYTMLVNKYFSQIGSSSNASRDVKVKLKIPMLSMQKCQTVEEAQKWYYDIISVPGLEFENGPGVWIDPKLDGISGNLVFDDNGDFISSNTRGDGYIGALIPFANKIDGVVNRFLPRCELRGEFIIPKKYRDHFNGPLRNICAGIMKRKEWTPDVNYVQFVIYDVNFYDQFDEKRIITIPGVGSYDLNFKNRGHKIDTIKKILLDLNQDFHIVDVTRTDNIPDIYEEYIKSWRNDWDWETDGLIMTIDGNRFNYKVIDDKYKITTCHKYNMALKPPANCAKSHIRGIETSVNRHQLSFVAIIDPVTLMDVRVGRATLDNYITIKKFDIGIGSTVLVKRSNDVIPKIINFYNEPDAKIKVFHIDKCPCCGSDLVVYNQNLMCPNEFGCTDIFKSKIENLIDVVGVKNFGGVIINAIVDYMHKNNIPLRIYDFIKGIELKNDHYDFEDCVYEFYNGGKRPENLKETIKDFFNNLTELKIIGAFNIPNIGVTSLKNNGIIDFDSLLKHIEKLNKTSVLEYEFDKTIFYWTKDPERFNELKKTIELLKPYFKKEVLVDENTKTYCISGEVEGFKSKADVVKFLESKIPTLKYTENFNSSVNYLLTTETSTGKTIKAKKYGIPIVSMTELLKLYSQ